MRAGWWLVWMFPFPGALLIAAIMSLTVPVSEALERKRESRYETGEQVVTLSRPGYRGWAWHVEDGQARSGA